MIPFLDASDAEREEFCGGYRQSQLNRWIFDRKVFDFSLMTDLRKETRAALTERFGTPFAGKIVAHNKSPDGTEKIVIEWRDGCGVEAVLLRDDRNHRTACISTQVGCAMKCVFCASGMHGFVRNLSRGEMVEQLLRLNALLPPQERLTHLVVMGTGEPLLNLPSLLSALDMVISPRGLSLSARRVTISTVGIPEKIGELAASARPYKLAISLHAPNDELRSALIPHNRQTGIAAISAAADDYAARVGRRVTMEYILIRGVNDAPSHAIELASLLARKMIVVNLIPLNEVDSLKWKTPSIAAVHRFVQILKDHKIAVKIRFRKGEPINAACGQLRAQIKR